ncbi:MAG: DUF4293 family protein [Bacteroidales bacterium]|jgi:hypothetical protein
MIQRIQTVWLFLCIILSLLLLEGNFLGFTGPHQESFVLNIHGLSSVSGKETEMPGSALLMTIVLIIIPAASAIAIFLFRKRSLQKLAVMIAILASLVLIICEGYYWSLMGSRYYASIVPGIKMVFPVIITILAILAYLGIRKDERLVKSYDRLR